MIPKCTNVLVNNRHQSELSVSGPKSAPHLTASTILGSVHDAPEIPIARYTRTFAAIIARVTGGARFRIAGRGGDCAMFEPAAAPAAWACAFAFRQSAHSVATFEPNENPLNVLPQLGQIGISSLLRYRANSEGTVKAPTKLPCAHVFINLFS